MHYEIKSLCAKKKWHEAIDFVSRIPHAPASGKIEDLVAIGSMIISHLPEGKPRDGLLVSVIEILLQFGDIEHPRPFLLALSGNQLREKFLPTLKEALYRSQWGFVYSA